MIKTAQAHPQPRFILRAAQARDQQAIRRLVRRARLNPLNLHWNHFLVVEDVSTATLAGIGQIRPHRDGTQELASLVVHPAYQGQGIGRTLVDTLIRRAAGPTSERASNPASNPASRPLYLFCRSEMEPYYTQFGFEQVDVPQLPATLAWMLRAGRFFGRLASAFRAHPVQVIAMRRVEPG